MRSNILQLKVLNQIPVLDKGYVAIHSCSPSGNELQALSLDFFRAPHSSTLDKMVHINLQIKCPLFVQLSFSAFGFICATKRQINSEVEAFIPTIAEVNAQHLEASKTIQDDIERTTYALLMNPAAYQMDHCDNFISQVISPVSVYNTLVVSGSLEQWNSYISQVGLPAPIESYRKVVQNAIQAEYPKRDAKR